MKTNKVFKWLYGVFMFLPMLAIGVTCAYVTFNKNAKDSYSGVIGYKYETNEVNNTQDLTSGNIYQLTLQNENTQYLDFGEFYAIYNLSDGANFIADFNAIQYFRLIQSASTHNIILQDSNSNNIFTINSINISYPFTFNVVLKQTTLNYSYFSESAFNVYDSNVVTTSYLDNAFYYAVDQFNDSGFNKVDFVSYFDMFYNNTSIWTTFANTYMNYVLFVSLAFFIPRVLFWFINFAFSLVDGFSNKYKEW